MVNKLPKVNTSNKWQSQYSNFDSLIPEPIFFLAFFLAFLLACFLPSLNLSEWSYAFVYSVLIEEINGSDLLQC